LFISTISKKELILLNLHKVFYRGKKLYNASFFLIYTSINHIIQI
jgi:hypothetical protein